MKKSLLLFALAFLLWNCGKDTHQVQRSFCFWKTDAYLFEEEDSLLKTLKVKHAYIRYFDVGWNPYAKEAAPIATVSQIVGDFEAITPSVFIANDVMQQSDKKQLDQLAQRISNRIGMINDEYFERAVRRRAYAISDKDFETKRAALKVAEDQIKRLNVDSLQNAIRPKIEASIKEILIDCDWTEKSKANYFYFLQQIKKAFPNHSIASTIRLWQYKYYEKAGIPPVDKGLLMCYNMNAVDNPKTANSIGSNKELESYLTHDDYQLPLDIALPLFSWSVLFRGNQFKGILSSRVEILNDTVVFKKTGDHKMMIMNDILLGDFYARYGDEVRVEKISDSEIREMIETIKDQIDIGDSTKVTFFSFDKKYIKDYGTKNIAAYYSLF
ncbi:hypothetical protein [Flavobacterium sp.]|uniref:hypothetical protein n=1 Tax=Flavobacterium sp. TaxID=239 RepID=UPI0039E45E9E